MFAMTRSYIFIYLQSTDLTHSKVLLVGGKDFTLVGRPLMDDGLVRVEATVIEKTLSYTKLHFAWVHMEKYKRLKCKLAYSFGNDNYGKFFKST